MSGRTFLPELAVTKMLLTLNSLTIPLISLSFIFWASYQGQTLARTEASDVEGAISSNDATDTRGFELSPEARAHADLKFTYVVTCQIYGKQKEGQKPEAADIIALRPKQPGKPRLQPNYRPKTMSMILQALQMFGLQT